MQTFENKAIDSKGIVTKSSHLGVNIKGIVLDYGTHVNPVKKQAHSSNHSVVGRQTQQKVLTPKQQTIISIANLDHHHQ